MYVVLMFNMLFVTQRPAYVMGSYAVLAYVMHYSAVLLLCC